MPELPDVEAWCHALRPRLVGQRISRIRLGSPFVLRTVDPGLERFAGVRIEAVRRVGKRVVFHAEGGLAAVWHPMVAGRLRWTSAGAPLPKADALWALDVPGGTCLATERTGKKRSSLHLVEGDAALSALDPGGAEPLALDVAGLRHALAQPSRTLKPALCDPTALSGIGNAFSDEILWQAGLSPLQRTGRLTEEAWARLHAAMTAVLSSWTARLCAEADLAFPDKVTAFKEGLAVHGRFRLPCPRCEAPIQRIRRGEHECNYCARCQCGGALLSDGACPPRGMAGDLGGVGEEARPAAPRAAPASRSPRRRKGGQAPPDA